MQFAYTWRQKRFWTPSVHGQKGMSLILENDLAACRATLGEEQFEASAEQGRAMTMEQAIEYALEKSVD